MVIMRCWIMYILIIRYSKDEESNVLQNYNEKTKKEQESKQDNKIAQNSDSNKHLPILLRRIALLDSMHDCRLRHELPGTIVHVEHRTRLPSKSKLV